MKSTSRYLEAALRAAARDYAECMVNFYAARETKLFETPFAADNFDRIQSKMLDAEAVLHKAASEVSRVR